MYAGSAVEVGTVDDIFYRLGDAVHASALLGAIPSETGDGKRLRQIKGTTPSLINMAPGLPVLVRVARCSSTLPHRDPHLGADRPTALTLRVSSTDELDSIDVLLALCSRRG